MKPDQSYHWQCLDRSHKRHHCTKNTCFDGLGLPESPYLLLFSSTLQKPSHPYFQRGNRGTESYPVATALTQKLLLLRESRNWTPPDASLALVRYVLSPCLVLRKVTESLIARRPCLECTGKTSNTSTSLESRPRSLAGSLRQSHYFLGRVWALSPPLLSWSDSWRRKILLIIR